MSTEQYDPKAIASAIHSARGMVYIAARNFGCTPQTIYNYAKRYPDIVQRAIDDERGLTTDKAETKLFDAIEEGEQWAVTFYLKTQGRNRGYVERLEQTTLTDEQINALIAAELAKSEQADPAEAVAEAAGDESGAGAPPTEPA